MAIALVQSVIINPTGNTVENITISPTGTGNLIVVPVVNDNNPACNITGITDNAGNTYVQVPGVASSTSDPPFTITTDIWYAIDSISGATTVTVTFDNPDNGVICINEYSGVVTTSPIDVIGTPVTSTGDPLLGPSLTITNPNDLLVTIVGPRSLNPTAVGSPWALAPGSFGRVATLIGPGSSGTYQASYSVASSTNYCASGVAFFALIVPLTLSLSDTQASSDLKIDEVEKPLSETQASSDNIAFARGLILSDSTTVSDTGPQAFSVQSSFIAPNPTPVFEVLTNELIPAYVKTYYNIEE